MQIIRTILWVLVTAMLVAFIAMNWTKVPVNIWPLSDGNYLHFDWPVGVVALAFFLLGAVPMWLVHRAGQWRLKRRIHSLENTVATSSPAAASLPEPTPASSPLAAPVLDGEPGFNPSQERSQI
jgi:lipopolysaccharide assembly protein A